MFVFALTLCARVHAQPGLYFTLPEMLDRSGEVFIGTILQRNTSGPPTSGISPQTLTVRVDQTLKGALPTSAIVIDGDTEEYVPATVTHGLFFLADKGGPQTWQLFRGYIPVYDLGPAMPRAVPKGLTPMRAVALVMAQALSASDAEMRYQILDRLSEIVSVNNPKAPWAIRLAAHLGETASFGQFCVTHIIPLTRVFDADPDIYVRVGALRMQAVFQDRSVLPALRWIAASAGDAPNAPGYANWASDTLAYYDTMATAPYMLRALYSPIHHVWYPALQSLVNTLGRKATPLLIDRIQSNDTGDQDSIIWWLYEVTGEHDPRVSGPLIGRRQEYMDYWHNWESIHKAEVGRLRIYLAALARK